MAQIKEFREQDGTLLSRNTRDAVETLGNSFNENTLKDWEMSTRDVLSQLEEKYSNVMTHLQQVDSAISQKMKHFPAH